MSKLKYIVLSIIAIIVLALIVLGTIDRNKRKTVLKDSDLVTATVTKIEPGRDQAIIAVKYFYKGTDMHSDFVTVVDSFKVGDTILLKVAKQYPEKYVEAVHIVKSK